MQFRQQEGSCWIDWGDAIATRKRRVEATMETGIDKTILINLLDYFRSKELRQSESGAIEMQPRGKPLAVNASVAAPSLHVYHLATIPFNVTIRIRFVCFQPKGAAGSERQDVSCSCASGDFDNDEGDPHGT